MGKIAAMRTARSLVYVTSEYQTHLGCHLPSSLPGITFAIVKFAGGRDVYICLRDISHFIRATCYPANRPTAKDSRVLRILGALV